MERYEPKPVSDDKLTKVWSVSEFCLRHRIEQAEKERLIQLFGTFATASELLNNARREPKFR